MTGTDIAVGILSTFAFFASLWVICVCTWMLAVTFPRQKREREQESHDYWVESRAAWVRWNAINERMPPGYRLPPAELPEVPPAPKPRRAWFKRKPKETPWDHQRVEPSTIPVSEAGKTRDD